MPYGSNPKTLSQGIEAYKRANNAAPKIIFLPNNGVIIAAATEKEINALNEETLAVLKAFTPGKRCH